jgi:hypothetical protein
MNEQGNVLIFCCNKMKGVKTRLHKNCNGVDICIGYGGVDPTATILSSLGIQMIPQLQQQQAQEQL